MPILFPLVISNAEATSYQHPRMQAICKTTIHDSIITVYI